MVLGKRVIILSQDEGDIPTDVRGLYRYIKSSEYVEVVEQPPTGTLVEDCVPGRDRHGAAPSSRSAGRARASSGSAGSVTGRYRLRWGVVAPGGVDAMPLEQPRGQPGRGEQCAERDGGDLDPTGVPEPVALAELNRYLTSVLPGECHHHD